ncbi:hypothetical protein ACVNIS_22700 [Sphaerotilaceae bacterium SBD11-9]
MNRIHLIRTLSLGLASLALATASAAASPSYDEVARLVEADGLVTDELRDAPVALLAEADGLITNQLRAEITRSAGAVMLAAGR